MNDIEVGNEVDRAFRVRLEDSVDWIEVAADETLLNALRDAGHPVASGCESGSCGTCKTTLVEGVADHRDYVLMDSERDGYIMPCVSRAKSETLVIQLGS
jgi:phthalate 4,5-dioxygenase reductase component